jgi:hypothetical protein
VVLGGQVADDRLRPVISRRLEVNPLQILGGPLAVLDADLERQQASLPAIVDQRLRGIEIAFAQPVLLEQVAPCP